MKAIAILLLLGVFLRHDTAFKIAELTGWSPSGVFYVEGALLEILLLGLLALFIWYSRSAWRSLAIATCGVGMLEAAMMATCQMLIKSRPPANMTQCDYVTGWPISAVTTTIYALLLAWLAGFLLWRAREP